MTVSIFTRCTAPRWRTPRSVRYRPLVAAGGAAGGGCRPHSSRYDQESLQGSSKGLWALRATGGGMGRQRWAALGAALILGSLIGGSFVIAPRARAASPSACVTVAHEASATWVMPNGVSAHVYVRQGPAIAVDDDLCTTAPVWVHANWRTATGSCNTVPSAAVPDGAFTIDPTLSSAALDASTSCGDLHVTWTSPSPPSVTPVVC